jgi:hypothetical protein
VTVFSSYFAVGTGAGGGEVDVDSFTGPGTLAPRSAFLPFGAFSGGVSLAVLAGGFDDLTPEEMIELEALVGKLLAALRERGQRA